MACMAVMTKSFAPDFELCAALNRSVLDNTPNAVHHHIIVPRSDLKLFGRLTGPRTHIRYEADLLPRTFVPIPFSNIMVNLARPFPPVRGWILQQVIKLAAIAASQDDVVLVVDSDAEFIRPFTAEMFVRDGKVRFFCDPNNRIDNRLPRHMTWHRVARALLGLPPGRAWTTAIAGELDFSECVLYGVFVDAVIGASANAFVSDDSLCLVYWQDTPLNLDSAACFVGGVRPTDVAAVIQSKSRTPPAVREAAFSALRAAQKTGQRSQERAETIKPDTAV
jgi:hypothetical protein